MTAGAAELRPLQVETNGINVIAEDERKGHPRDLFWPWFAANVSVLGLSYGAFVLDFGISFWQALVVGVVGIVLSFLACGFIAVAGKRGSAPTMVLSRAAFGVNGNKLSAIRGGTVQDLIGALMFMMTGFGLGWVNCAADYSRYLPRRASSAGVVGWTTFASSIAPIFLLIFGLLLAGSSSSLSSAIGADPIGALATLLPTWFLVPFAIVAVLGLIGGSVLDIYSSGLALLTLGVRIPRYQAALIDGTVMTLGTIYVVFVAHNFIGQFEGFLITLGVPIAAWCGIMLADIALRRRDYAEPELFTPAGGTETSGGSPSW